MSVPPAMMVAVPTELPTTGPLIGRGDELASLIADAIDPPAPGAVLLSGEAGVGKTRLLHELREHAKESGWRVLVGHCLDFGDTPLPFLPFGEVFARLDAESPELAEELARAHIPVTRLMPGRRLPDVHSADGRRVDRTELFEAVHAALDHVGRDAPLLLVVEDVHWADQSTRELLSFLFARRFGARVSLVVSYRSDDLHRRHPLRATAAEWTRASGVRRIVLAPLPDSDVRHLVRSLHPGSLRESDLHLLVERAEGNAFFAEELVAAAGLGCGAVPDDLADLLLLRLDQLEESARLVVRVASVAGRRVAHELLARVVGLDAAMLEQALRAAVERNVLVPVGADDYAFRHALLAEAVYDDLLPGERVRLHSAYVDALRDGELAGSAGVVARHARAAHDTPTAIRMSIRAGDEAMAVAGPVEAARHYEVALELLANLDSASGPQPVDVVDLTVKASEASAAAGHPHRAIAIVEERLSRTPAAAPGRVQLLVALAEAALRSDSSIDPLAVSTEAVQLVPDEPPSPLRARVLAVHAHANADRHRDDDAARWGARALVLARHLQLAGLEADVAMTLARLEERTGDPDASRRALHRIVVEARAVGDGAAELRAMHHLGGTHLEEGELRAALDVFRQGSERAHAIGRPWAPYGLDARIMAGIVAYQSGDWADVDRIVDVSGQAPPAMAEAALSAVGMATAAGRGDERAAAVLPHVRPWWDRDGLIAILSGGAAIDLHGDRGDVAAALASYEEVVATVGALWQLADFQAVIRLSGLMLGQLAAAVPRASGAERAVLAHRGEDLVAAAGRAATRPGRRAARRGPESEAWIARVRAEHLRLRWLTGVQPPTQEELIAQWQVCVDAFGRYPHVFELARSQARLAAALSSAGRVSEARPHAEAARATARRLDARPLAAELRALGPTGQAHRQPASRIGEALTSREHEILQLVAQGRSNREIGGRLYISAKTVSVHVSNILAKLDAGGRTEAAAIARRRGLLDD
ncbi:MAG: AAA family ATPase [Actinomycetota bacterium]|nr:AAA family ATPase [Actinomycetota bacterium]